MSDEYTAAIPTSELRRLVAEAEEQGVENFQVVIGLNPPPTLSLRVNFPKGYGDSVQVDLARSDSTQEDR